jgi:hypothetical protein
MTTEEEISPYTAVKDRCTAYIQPIKREVEKPKNLHGTEETLRRLAFKPEQGGRTPPNLSMKVGLASLYPYDGSLSTYSAGGQASQNPPWVALFLSLSLSRGSFHSGSIIQGFAMQPIRYAALRISAKAYALRGRCRLVLSPTRHDTA